MIPDDGVTKSDLLPHIEIRSKTKKLPHTSPSDKTRKHSSSHEAKTRELPRSPNKLRQPCTVILYDNDDFAPIKSQPISHDFASTSSSPKIDEKMNKVRQKQFKLLTIHERLGHISF